MGSPCPRGAALHILESGLVRGLENLQGLWRVYSANSDVSRYTRRDVYVSLMGGSSCLMGMKNTWTFWVGHPVPAPRPFSHLLKVEILPCRPGSQEPHEEVGVSSTGDFLCSLSQT